MEILDLPLVRVSANVSRAFANAIEADSPAVLCQGGRGTLRLLRFEVLVHSAESVHDLAQLESEPVLKLGADFWRSAAQLEITPDFFEALAHHNFIESWLTRAGYEFGVLRVHGSDARLASRLDWLGARPSGLGAKRCRRGQKPPGIPNQEWYHYYPPETTNPRRPNECVLCGAPLP